MTNNILSPLQNPSHYLSHALLIFTGVWPKRESEKGEPLKNLHGPAWMTRDYSGSSRKRHLIL